MYLNHYLKLKPMALAVKYACYAIGHDWRVANGLPVQA
jgi:hypothetical protein